jgi:hypothetical protein
MSNNLDLAQVAPSQNNKEVTINDQGGQLDAALTEQFVADVSAGNVALTAEQYRRAMHIKATGAATAGRTVTLQAIKKFSIISNTSTTDSVAFVLGTATITLAAAPSATQPTMAVIYTDGTANGLYQVSSGVGGGGVDEIDELVDVLLFSLMNGDILQFNGLNWVNVALVQGSGRNLPFRGAMEEMRDRARDLGIVLDEALVRDAERARTELDTLSQVISANLIQPGKALVTPGDGGAPPVAARKPVVIVAAS